MKRSPIEDEQATRKRENLEYSRKTACKALALNLAGLTMGPFPPQIQQDLQKLKEWLEQEVGDCQILPLSEFEHERQICAVIYNHHSTQISIRTDRIEFEFSQVVPGSELGSGYRLLNAIRSRS